MSWFIAFLNGIVSVTWRKRWMAALVIALFLITIIPLMLSGYGPDIPVRFNLSAESPGRIEALVFFEQIIPFPPIATPLVTTVFVLGMTLTMIAILRIFLKRHWIWLPVAFVWPLAIFYYLFGPEENNR